MGEYIPNEVLENKTVVRKYRELLQVVWPRTDAEERKQIRKASSHIIKLPVSFLAVICFIRFAFAAYMDDIENRIVGDACDMTQFLCYIDICFEWSKSPEGRSFWERENRFLGKCFGDPDSIYEAQNNLFKALIDGGVRKL